MKSGLTRWCGGLSSVTSALAVCAAVRAAMAFVEYHRQMPEDHFVELERALERSEQRCPGLKFDVHIEAVGALIDGVGQAFPSPFVKG